MDALISQLIEDFANAAWASGEASTKYNLSFITEDEYQATFAAEDAARAALAQAIEAATQQAGA